MASADILTLSSSPPRLFRAFRIPSSPALPSPSELFRKKPVGLRMVGGLAPNPANVTASLTTKSTFATLPSGDLPSPRKSLLLESGSGCKEKVDSKESKRTKRRSNSKLNSAQEVDSVVKAGKEKTSKREDASINGVETKKGHQERAAALKTDPLSRMEKTTRKPRSKNAEKPSEEDVLKERPARKPRTKKTNEEKQTQLPKSRVVKPSMDTIANLSKKTTKHKKPEVTSRYFSGHEEQGISSEDCLGNGLLDAVKRRTCWTPPKPTVKVTSITTPVSGATDDTNGSVGCTSLEGRSKGFSDLFDNFAYNCSIQAPISGKKILDSSATRKRKLVEMVTTNIPTSNSITAAAKTKAPKKKVRTITDQAISAYSNNESPSTLPDPLLHYFTLEAAETATNDGFIIPAKPRSKSRSKVSSKRGNGTAKAPILLSPGSALKQVSNQDFVFGTSSQLAREDSPAFLRDIHAAMQASNKIDDDPFMDLCQTSTVAVIGSRKNSASPAKRNLWCAAARDTGGKLLDIEMVDLVNSPAAMKNPGNCRQDTVPVNTIVTKDSDVWHDIEERSKNTASTNSKVNPSQFPGMLLGIEPVMDSSSNIRRPGLSPRALRIPHLSDTVPLVTQSSAANSQVTTGFDIEKPDYSSYTNTELAEEIASYRFKPVKNRNQMITLLEKCWESKKRTALGALQANAMHSSSNPLSSASSERHEEASHERARGRAGTNTAGSLPKAKTKVHGKTIGTVQCTEPTSSVSPSKPDVVKKTQKQSEELFDEISDSDAPLTPSPPRRRLSQIRTPPLPLQISASTTVEESPALTPIASQARLFKHISRAVTNAPPSKDPSNPSWHEKILLYDPIILEDLTAWLNTGALEKSGWDGEVNPGEVKKWCISKSICCLWKENLRGGVRSRY